MSEFQFQPDFYNNKADISMSIVSDASQKLNLIQKISLAAVGFGILLLFMAWGNVSQIQSASFLASSLGLIAIGTLSFSYFQYKNRPEGIKNNGVMFGQMTARGITAWIATIVITGFYVLLYWYPHLLGLVKDGANTGLVGFFDPLSKALNGNPASQWFVYGTLYLSLIHI